MAGKTSIGRLILDFVANTAKFQQDVTKAKNSLRANTKAMRDDIALLTGAFKAVVAAVSVEKILSYFNSIDEAMEKVRFSTTSLTISTQTLQKKMYEAYKQMPGSINDAAEATISLSNFTNTSSENFVAAIKTANQFSRVTKQNVTDAVKKTSQSLKGWGIDTKNTAEALEYLYKVSKVTGIGVEELQDQLGGNAGELQKFGFSYREAAMILGNFTQNGIEAERAMAGLAKAATVIAKDGKYSFFDGFAKAAQDIKSARREEEALIIATKYFGDKSARLFVDAFKNGGFELDKLKEKIESTMGLFGKEKTIDERFSMVLKGFGDQAVEIMKQLKEIFIQLEEPLKILVEVINRILWVFKKSAEGWNMILKGLDEYAARAAPVVAKGYGMIKGDSDGVKNLDLGTITHYANGDRSKYGTSELDKKSTEAQNAISGWAASWEQIKLKIGESMDGFADNVSDNFTAIVMGTKKVGQAFKDMAMSILSSITKIIMHQMIAEPLANAATSFFGLPSTPKGKAVGGPVGSNTPYIVGELGPELFVPDTAGSIVPNDKLGGGITVNQYNNFSGSGSADMLMALKKSEERIIRRVADTIGRGGSLSSALRA